MTTREPIPIVLTAPGVEPVVQIDPYKVVRERMFVAGNSGSGKSQLLRLFVEQAAMQMPVFVIDTQDEWSTIRTHVPAALIGTVARGADAPADYRIAGELAMMLLKANCSAVLDLSDLDRPDQARFVRCFIDGLFKIPDELRTPRLIVIDEAHRFAPENAGEAESRAAVIRLMDSGRKFMLGGVLASQRFAKVAKSAIGEANILLIGRFAQAIDRKLAAEATGLSQRSCGQFSKFAPGEFMALGLDGYDEAIRFRANSATITKPPQPGTQIAAPARSGQLQRLVGKLGALRVPAEDDEPQAIASATADHRADHRVTELEVILASVVRERDALAEQLEFTLGVVRSSVADLTQLIPVADAEPAQELDVGADESDDSPPAEPEPPPKERANGRVSGAPRRLLITLAQAGGRPVSKRRAALMSKISPRSSTWRAAQAELTRLGFMTRTGGDLSATAAGIRAAGPVTQMPKGSALVAHWRTQLGKGAARSVFDVLVNATGPVARSDLAFRSNISEKSSTWRAALATLRGLSLVDDVENKTKLVLAKELR